MNYKFLLLSLMIGLFAMSMVSATAGTFQTVKLYDKADAVKGSLSINTYYALKWVAVPTYLGTSYERQYFWMDQIYGYGSGLAKNVKYTLIAAGPTSAKCLTSAYSDYTGTVRFNMKAEAAVTNDVDQLLIVARSADVNCVKGTYSNYALKTTAFV